VWVARRNVLAANFFQRSSLSARCDILRKPAHGGDDGATDSGKPAPGSSNLALRPVRKTVRSRPDFQGQPTKWSGRGGTDHTNLIGMNLRKPHVLVGAGDDAARAAASSRYHVLRDDALGGNRPDPILRAFREPHIAIGIGPRQGRRRCPPGSYRSWGSGARCHDGWLRPVWKSSAGPRR
jgi:hypothetical protein